MKALYLLTFSSILVVGGKAPGFEEEGTPRPKTKYANVSDEEAARLERLVEQTVRERGVVQSASVQTIRCQLEGGGKIVWIVESGAIVKKGDELLRFDSQHLKDDTGQQDIHVRTAEVAVAQAKSNLAAAEAQQAESLHAAKTEVEAAKVALDDFVGPGGEYELQLKEIEGQMVVAQGRMEIAEKLLKESESLEAKGGISRHELAIARQTILEARTELEIAQARRKLLTERTRARRKSALEAAVTAAQMAVLRITTRATATVAAAKAELQSQEQKLALESDKLRRLRESLQHCIVRAPRDGQVMYADETRRWSTAQSFVPEVGAVAALGREILRMPDLNRLQVQGLVNETVIDRVKPGQPALVRINHNPYRPLRGKVEYVANQADQRSFFQASVTEFAVIVSLEEIPEGLKPGMTCEVEIDVAGPAPRPKSPRPSKAPNAK